MPGWHLIVVEGYEQALHTAAHSWAAEVGLWLADAWRGEQRIDMEGRALVSHTAGIRPRCSEDSSGDAGSGLVCNAVVEKGLTHCASLVRRSQAWRVEGWLSGDCRVRVIKGEIMQASHIAHFRMRDSEAGNASEEIGEGRQGLDWSGSHKSPVEALEAFRARSGTTGERKCGDRMAKNHTPSGVKLL